MQSQIRSLIMIRIFIIHLDPFLSIPAAFQSTNKQLHLIVWVRRASSCTENVKHNVIASLTGHQVVAVLVAGVLAGVVLTIRSAVTN